MTRQKQLLILTLLVGAMLWLISAPLPRYVLAFAFLWVLPGLAWATLVPRQGLAGIERYTVALGLSLVITPITTLLAHYLPGPLTRTLLMCAVGGITCLPLLWRLLTHHSAPTSTQGSGNPQKESLPIFQRLWQGGWIWLGVALLIAAGLRLTNLGYSEFQGDEGTVMVRAAEALAGNDEIIFQHKKGPAELMVVMAQWRLTGITNEWMARLPFAWANLLGLAAVFLIARRVSAGPHTAGIAACLIAIEGYLTAFGRLAQYQSLVFALSTLGLLCLLLYQHTGRAYLIPVSAALFAGGFLGHYDAALPLPAGLFLIASRLWQERPWNWHVFRSLLLSALLGLVLIALFYVPFLNSPFIAYAQEYLGERVGNTGRFYNRVGSMAEASLIYNSVYLMGGLLAALLVYIFYTMARWHLPLLKANGAKTQPIPGWLTAGLPALLIVAAITGAIWPDSWEVEKSSLAWIPYVALFLLAFLAPGQRVADRALWVWMSVPAFFYLFRVSSPNTHIHTFFAPWIILASLGITTLTDKISESPATTRSALKFAGIAFYALCGFYTITVFVAHTPEYLRTFSASRLSLYWTPYDQIPETGLFGFPYRAGWKVAGYLMDQGEIGDYYQSNEESAVTAYYMRQALRWQCSTPDTYIVADNVQDAKHLPMDEIEEDYHLTAVITVEGQPKMRIYKFAAAEDPVTYRVEDYAWRYDLGTTPEAIAIPGPKTDPKIPEAYTPLATTLGDFARLRGYTLNVDHAIPGGHIDLTVIWEGIKPAPTNYQVFTHLYDGETMRGQLDRQPLCESYPTSKWQPEQILVDRYRIPVAEDALSGSVPLLMGMYDLETLERLPVQAEDVSTENVIHLSDVVIRVP